MDETTRVIVELLAPVLSALGLAGAAWILSKVPGPVRELLGATIHGKDMAVLASALQKRATAEVADRSTPPPTPADLVHYLERVRGELLTKLAPTPEALETMAASAIATATTAAGPAVVVAPVVPADVLVDAGVLPAGLQQQQPGPPGRAGPGVASAQAGAAAGA